MWGAGPAYVSRLRAAQRCWCAGQLKAARGPAARALPHLVPTAPPPPGVRPDVALAKACGLEIGARGGIRVDEHMRTSDPNIYAVGERPSLALGLRLLAGTW